jgi:hypothetical protein
MERDSAQTVVGTPGHAKYSEKPDEYSRRSESCQANEILEDSLFFVEIPTGRRPANLSTAEQSKMDKKRESMR